MCLVSAGFSACESNGGGVWSGVIIPYYAALYSETRTAHAALIVPAVNEAECLPYLFDATPRDLFRWIVVAGKGSTDGTAEIAREAGRANKDALLAPRQFGNDAACFPMRLFWGRRYNDLGPARAIRGDVLNRMAMEDRNHGWTIEMRRGVDPPSPACWR
jgi:hypothetical protein